MSFCVKKILQFPQGGLEYNPNLDNGTTSNTSLPLLGGVLRDTRYVWQAKGPILEVRNTKTGTKVGAWAFGGILKDSNTRVVCVNEIPRPNGRISLLAVGIDCTISGGIVCIFDVFSSKVIRAIQIKEKISSLHIIDPGIEDLHLPGPLRNFDGILAAGTEGGEVVLIDICRQICEESIHTSAKRDELNPSQLVLMTAKHIPKIEHYKERAVRDGNHLGIHLNAVTDRTTEHFVLKGPKDDDRIHVNKEEVATSALYYCPQLTSLLVGYNFGAFQLWDLTTLNLVYTSPVCEEHFPITYFALQEPTDDPRAFCYIWVAYGNTELYQTGLPYAVMYSLCYESKEYQEGYGHLYHDFHYCTIRFQIELGQLEEHRGGILPKGGFCLGFQPITKLSTSKESFTQSPAGDTLALCLISWTLWFSKTDTQTCCLVFDLNQWYKEQMPSFTQWKDSTNYILGANLSELIHFNGHKGSTISNVLMDTKSLTQFVGVQKLEEHFYPSSLSFSCWILRECDVINLYNQGLQKHLLSQIETAGPLCLVRPTDVCRQAITIGLTPLFVDLHPNRSLTTESQREIVLNLALEHHLIGWLCKCASEWANGSFSSAGCSLDFIIAWAFQRAVTLKNNCDKFCVPLFDYSQSRLDGNASVLLNSCTRQINTLCILYKHIVNKLWSYVGCLDMVKDHYTGLEMISIYFEVLQWLVNVGLLPECHPSTYPRPDNSERISAPYPMQELSEYYNEKRAELRLLSQETFENTDSLLFIDNLIERKCGGAKLQKQWQDDGGGGLYPPPSLQSLIRTYLVDGAGISHKHSLVIYLFLDLAMALDQSRYSSVVTHLIKFPAVFKVSPSVIKITQAFWQLDHGDFTTAMEQLLDPFVLGEDLQSWHHTIAMRSLLIHKQPNFALLYMQIRKPPITDEKDVLTAISLFIANNMLDEAFYFKKQHQNNNEEKLLAHLFHECSKNDALHLVLYKCLNTEEEKAFFKYLKSVENPTSEDLQIFYYLLRSRFMEAFDAHSKIRRKGQERQGLIGQSMASKTDQIVKIFKTLLPDVNKNLVDYVRKERMNLWKEVQRPTPMSVFVHNTIEQVKYKSTLIHAALAKAKDTFPDNTFYKDLITEETPFLRTPTACKNGKRVITPVITPRIIEMNESGDDSSAPPNKRMRISPRGATATVSPRPHLKNTSQSLTLTPIVKRKTSLQRDGSQMYSNVNVCTPQSILKVRNLVKRKDSITDDTFQDEDHENQIQSASLHLQPRCSLSLSAKRQHVQFDDATRFSTSLSDQSSRLLDSTRIEDHYNVRKSSLSSKDISSILSTSANDDVSDDVFYSPDNSASEELMATEERTKGADEEEAEEKMDVETDVADDHVKKDAPERVEEEEEEEGVGEPIKEKEDSLRQSAVEVTIGSPRARRSYKRALSPTRSSPRLSKLQPKKEEAVTQTQSQSGVSVIFENQSMTDTSTSADTGSPRPTRIVPKIKGRKSLSRQVLEHNAFSKLRAPPPDTVVSKEYSYSKSETITVTEKSLDESKRTTVESSLKIVDTEEKDPSLQTPTTHKTHTATTSVTKKQEVEKTFDTDSSFDSDTSSYQYGIQEESGPKLSDSLQEYIDFLMSSDKKRGDTGHQKDLSQVKLDFSPKVVEVKSADAEKMVEHKEEESEMPHEISSDIEEVEENREGVLDKQGELDRLIDELGENDDESSDVEEIPEQVEAAPASQTLTELKPMEVQGPSTDRTDFVTVRPKYTDDIPMDVYEDLSNDGNDQHHYEQEVSFDELEANIFGVSADEEATFEKNRRSAISIDTPSDSFNVPESEIAFMEDPLTEEGSELKTDNTIVIISSSDDEESSDKLSINSAYSKTTEEIQNTSDSTDSTRSTDSHSDDDDDDHDDNHDGADDRIVFQYEAQDARGDFIKGRQDRLEPEADDVLIINEDSKENLEEVSPEAKDSTFRETSKHAQTREDLNQGAIVDERIDTVYSLETDPLENTPIFSEHLLDRPIEAIIDKTDAEPKESSESEIPSTSRKIDEETVHRTEDARETLPISDTDKIVEDPLKLDQPPDEFAQGASPVLTTTEELGDQTRVTEAYVEEDKDVDMVDTSPVLETRVEPGDSTTVHLQSHQTIKESNIEEDKDVEMVEALPVSENVEESTDLTTAQLQSDRTTKESVVMEEDKDVDMAESSQVVEETGESGEPTKIHRQFEQNVESVKELRSDSLVKEVKKDTPTVSKSISPIEKVKEAGAVPAEAKETVTGVLTTDDSSSKVPIPKKRPPKLDQSTNTTIVKEEGTEKVRESGPVPDKRKKSEKEQSNSKKETVAPRKRLPKIDQSTNTTIITEEAPSSTSKEKMDQSSNTTVLLEDKSSEILEEEKKEDVAKREEKKEDVAKRDDVKGEIKKVHSRHKMVSEADQNTSSSDTTEGETYRRETVVVEVHTPVTETTPSRRTTRRNSTSTPQVADVDVTEESRNLFVAVEKNDDIFSKNLVTRSIEEIKRRMGGKRTRRALSTSDVPTSGTPAGTAKTDDAPIDCDPNRSTEIIDDAAMIKLTLRKKRSASVDVVKTFSRPRTSKRSKSIEEQAATGEEPKERRAASVAQMPVISEESAEESAARNTRKTRSVVDTYTTARRLTRRQANIVKEMTNVTDAESVDDEMKKQIDVEPIDPIHLLDKEAFEGKPDPEETKVYEPSSPSTSTASAQRNRRRSRSNSVVSDVSISPSLPVTPGKSGRATRSQTKSPPASGISTRSRKKSETGSVASEQSESSTPSKRSKRKTQNEDVESSARSTRSRSASISSVKSGESSSRKVARPRRLVSAKSDLPEITEEKVADNVEGTSTSDKKPKSEAKVRRKK